MLFGDVFEPVDDLPVEVFLDGDVGEGGGGGGSVPVFFVWREPDDVSGADLFDGAAGVLRPSEAGGDEEGLAEGVGVPGGAGAGLEGDLGGLDEGGAGGLEEGVDADVAGEPVCRALGGGLRAVAPDLHGRSIWETRGVCEMRG